MIMNRHILLTQLISLALPGCKSPEARRALVMDEVEDSLRVGQHEVALRTLEKASRKAPNCLEFAVRQFEINVDYARCGRAYELLPAIASSPQVQLLHALYSLTCGGDPEALDKAWKAGYGRHPDLLKAMAGLKTEGARGAYQVAKLLVKVRDEGDVTTLRAWLSAMPVPGWSLETYLEVAGLLPELHRARDPLP